MSKVCLLIEVKLYLSRQITILIFSLSSRSSHFSILRRTMATHNVKVTYSGARSQSLPDEVSVSIIGLAQNLKLIKFEELQSKFGSCVNQKVLIFSNHTGAKNAHFIRKFTFWKSHFWQNSQFQNLIFHQIHIFKVSFFTKFTFSKSHFSQNSHFSSIKFLVI